MFPDIVASECSLGFIGSKERIAQEQESKERKEEEGSVFGEEREASHKTSHEEKTGMIAKEKAEVREC